MTRHQFSTRAIHVGQEPEKEYGAVIPPVYLNATYAQEYPGKPKKHDYGRAGNPNFDNVELTIASLENGNYATVFNSGLGAASSIFGTLGAGQRVIAVDDLYGGTYRLLQLFKNFSLEPVYGNFTDFSWLEQEISKGAALLWIESPTNPLLKLIDIQKVCEMAHAHEIPVVVDNTFASPYFQKPLDLGADIVVHSSTKYLGGHSDLIGGMAITNHDQWKQKLDYNRLAMGFNPGAFDAWLISRSLKTLALRMEKHQENALELAKRLEQHQKVKKVIYPGLPSHPQHELAKKQMTGYSGIISVIFDIDYEQAMQMVADLKIFTLAENLGGVESLVNHPSSMTHASIPREVRLAAGLEDSLLRFSVGVEDVEDLWQDLQEQLS